LHLFRDAGVAGYSYCDADVGPYCHFAALFNTHNAGHNTYFYAQINFNPDADEHTASYSNAFD